MKTIIFCIAALFAVLLLVGCTQTPVTQTPAGIGDSNTQIPVELGAPKMEGCTQLEHGWKCVAQRNTLDENSWGAKVSELNDTMANECGGRNFDSQGFGSSDDSQYSYYCDYKLTDAGKACNSSEECIGSCIPLSDTNYEFGFVGKQSCPTCKGECSFTLMRAEEKMTFVVLNNGFLEHSEGKK